jgi:hypothetical protein
MPVGIRERHVLPFYLHVAMVPEEADAVSMADAVKMLKAIYDEGKAYMLIGEHIAREEEDDGETEPPKGDNAILIRDMKIERDGTVTLLLHHADAHAADPALMQIRNGRIRNAGKRTNEGVAHAAHLLISTEKHLSASGQSCALLERVPNLGRSTVIAFLNRLLRIKAKNDQMEFKNNKTKRHKRCHPKLESYQQLSPHLKSDLETGRMSSIELVRRHVVHGFEEDNVVIPVTHTVVHKVINAPTGQRAFDLIERAKAWARGHNFEEIQLRFRKNATSQHLSPRFAADIADAKDAVYSRFEVISGFRSPLPQCPTAIVDEIRRKMLELFSGRDAER